MSTAYSKILLSYVCYKSLIKTSTWSSEASEIRLLNENSEWIFLPRFHIKTIKQLLKFIIWEQCGKQNFHLCLTVVALQNIQAVVGENLVDCVLKIVFTYLYACLNNKPLLLMGVIEKKMNSHAVILLSSFYYCSSMNSAGCGLILSLLGNPILFCFNWISELY